MSKTILRQLTNGAKFNLNKFKSKIDLENEINEDNDLDSLKSKDKIHCIGEDIPPLIDSFDKMKEIYNLNDEFMENLSKANFKKPTPVQSCAIPLMMNKRELICCSFTGSGKTFAFLLPVICKLKEIKSNTNQTCLKSIILAPTCELARQIYRECNWFAYGSDLSVCLINNVYKFMNNDIDILITTPKRLVYLIEKKKLKLNQLEYLVIDECDRLFQNIFRQQLSIIYKACSGSPNISRALFSATFDKKLEKWFQLNLDNVVTLLIGDKLNVPKCIKQELKYVGDRNGKFMAIKEIIAEGIQPPVLIFCQYKNSANVLYGKMKEEKYNVAVLHSEIAEAKRSEIINQFRAGKIWFLICTELMGRGIDFKNVSCLINYDYPPDPVTYIHRVGRTGRAGKEGRSITLFTHDEMEHPTKLRYIVQIMKQAGYEPPEYLQDLKSLSKLSTVKRKRKYYDEDGKRKQKKIKNIKKDLNKDKLKDKSKEKLKIKKLKQRKLINKKINLKSKNQEN